MRERCSLDALLSAGGPVRVALRPCCLAALVGRRPGLPDDRDAVGAGHAGLPEDMCGAGLMCAAVEAELQVAP
jgi:hypothetical protein